MGNDKPLRENLPTPSHRRRSLYNITNLSLSASWAANSREDLLLKSSSKSNEFQLRDENAALKKLLKEKEAALVELTRNLQQLLIQLRRQAQVNEEIISYNSRLSREGGHVREQLKFLQHEYCQMTVAFRIGQSELQAKFAEAQGQLAKSLQDTETGRSTDEATPTLTKKPRNGVHRRHSTAGNLTSDCEDSNFGTEFENWRPVEEVGKRSSLLSRSSTGGLASEESTVRIMSQQAENSTTSCATFRQQHVNRYSDLLGLEPMIEVCEEDSSQESMSVASTVNEDSSVGCKSVSGLTISRTTSSRISVGDSGASVRNTSGSVRTSNDVSAASTKRGRASVPTSSPVPHFSRRASSGCGRPTRKAAENITSYREPLLNTKMRRPS